MVGTPTSSALIRELVPAADLAELGDEEYVIRRVTRRGRDFTVVAAHADRGVLYGAFHLLRLVQTRRPLKHVDLTERPAAPLRVANHWDNKDGSIERGYAGRSFLDWEKLPQLDSRYNDYARVMASLGINGAVINNVNTPSDYLAEPFLTKLAALAGVLRRYGVALYVTANFAAPIDLGGLDTADPLDPGVRSWWTKKAEEIYGRIEDFGGFLVKANSEGRPGPLDYGRTHADGANLLAGALRPYGGIVMWRAFVHDSDEKWDRQAYLDFTPLDGKFADNTVVQRGCAAASTLQVLDSSLRSLARAVVVPPAARCVHALDAGPDSAPVLKDYTRLSPAGVWHEGAAFGWVGNSPAATDTGLFDVVRRDYVRSGAPTVLRLKLPAGRCTAHLLTGDPNTFNRPLIVRVDGTETARSEQLDGREFTWLRIPLDGGSSGREVDLELSTEKDKTWHLSACVVLAEDTPQPAR